MVKKWIKAVFTHPAKILKSLYYRKKNINKDLADRRITICRNCKDKIEVQHIGEVCRICGCILDNKVRLDNEHCELFKW